MSLYSLLTHQAQERPDARALVFKDQVLTYRELLARVDAWADALAQRGIQSGDAFGLVMRNCPEFVVTFFALARLGASAVPVNFMLKADEITYIFEDAGVVGVITQPAFLKHVEEAKKRLPRLRDIVICGEKRQETGSQKSDAHFFDEMVAVKFPRPSVAASPVDSSTVAMIIYTSGTTGKPKGAMLTHANFLANVEQCYAAVPSLNAKDVFLCLLPMFHSFSWTVCVLLPLYLGCKVVIIESVQPFDNVIKQIFKQRVTAFIAVPPIFAALLRVPFWWPMRWINPLRFCISGAAALPNAVQQKFEKKFGLPLMEGYGLTEASPVVSLNPEDGRVPGSVGKPLPGIEIRIAGEKGEALPVGEVGEICVKGRNTMKGYYKQEQATKEAFLDEQLTWLRTGDVGRLDENGYLHISDRKKDLIIVKGLNVYPKEIEDLLLSHPAVAEAAVVGMAEESGDERIHAFVTLKEGQSADKHELMKLCRASLASYKCPRDLEIRKELPKNTLGKILKRELRKA